jgi:hypothetical protein
MSPQVNLLKLRSELQTRLDTCPQDDHFTRALIIDKIESVSKQIIRESVRLSVAREQASRSFELTNTAPIKCGLRGATGHHKPEKTGHWYWDEADAKDAKKLERIAVAVEKFLFTRPERATVRKLCLLGGFKKAVREIGLSAMLEVPEAARKEKGQKLLKLLEDKINGEDPFKGLV